MDESNQDAIHIGPQPGPQSQFLTSVADICFYGGAAGGGKTYALLLDPLRYYDNSRWSGVIFRNTTKQIRNPGGLWDTASNLYPLIGAYAKDQALEWIGPSGWKLKMSYLEHESDVYGWQGAQLAWIGFDEVTHFTRAQFFYMLSRNRSMSGTPGTVRATCNPDPDSWVRDFIAWWLDDNGEFPRPERSGVLRWFISQGEELHWADTKEELFEKFGRGPEIMPKSFTFISAKVTDNQILLKSDPAYLANLNALSRVDRARLLDGNWLIKAAAGDYFKESMFQVVDAIPSKVKRSVRFWDRAATEPNDGSNPDWTAGVKISELEDGRYLVEDVDRFRLGTHERDARIVRTAAMDGVQVRIGLEQEPGASGKAEVQYITQKLAGYNVKAVPASGDKETRAGPVSSQAQAGNILVMRAKWNKDFFTELTAFPKGAKDDQVDGFSGAFNLLARPMSEPNIR